MPGRKKQSSTVRADVKAEVSKTLREWFRCEIQTSREAKSWYRKYSQAFRRCSSHSDIMGLIAELVHYEYGPDEYLIAQLINQWHLSRQIPKGDKIFFLRLLVNVSRTSGFRFNVVIYNNLFKAFGALQEKEMLKVLYEEAKGRDDIELNVISYSSLFKAFGALQENEMLRAVYKKQKRTYRANVISYNSLFKAFGAARKRNA